MCVKTYVFGFYTHIVVYKQAHDFVYLGGNIYHDANLSIEVDRRIRNAWCGFRDYTFELYDWPSVSP